MRLRDRFPRGRPCARAGAEVEEAIRPGGISRVKAARIVAILAAIEAGNPGGEGLDLG